MNNSSTDLDRFVHALITPLTVLYGAIGLLRRHTQRIADPRIVMLLGTLERNVERLRLSCELLLEHTEVEDAVIRITIPVEAFSHPRGPAAITAEAEPEQTKAASLPALAAEGLTLGEVNEGISLLFIANGELLPPPIHTMFRSLGYQLIWVTNTPEGIDLARQIRPSLILLDVKLDQFSQFAPEVLTEDPDTKMIPLVVLESTQAIERNPAQAAIVLREQIEANVAVGRAQKRAQPHILVVDDEIEISRLIADQFNEEGYITACVGSGTEALRIGREQQFDLILLDLLLPDLDGFTVLGGLRAQPETQLTPIILLSALNSPAEKVRGLRLGADDYITKPFSAAELNARVQAALRRSEREGGANPSTRLPGNNAIERAISRRIEQDEAFVVCYCDIDNFKAFNDSYGFLKGDAVIQRTAQILLDTIREHGNPDDFVGHIGGDDFVMISTPDLVERICQAVITRFDTTAPLFYDPTARARGYISGVDRQGRAATFPLVSISIAVMSGAKRPFSHPGEVAQRSVEPKKRAKLLPGSAYLIDE